VGIVPLWFHHLFGDIAAYVLLYTQVEEVSGVLQHSLCQLPVSVERVAEGAPQTAVDNLMHTASKHLYTRRG